jgi:acylphosphatase
VGFRYFAVERAQRRGLTGWVRNLGENRVEVRAAGPSSELDAFLAELRLGPPQSRVDAVQADWQPPAEEFSGFRVVAGGW